MEREESKIKRINTYFEKFPIIPDMIFEQKTTRINFHTKLLPETDYWKGYLNSEHKKIINCQIIYGCSDSWNLDAFLSILNYYCLLTMEQNILQINKDNYIDIYNIADELCDNNIKKLIYAYLHIPAYREDSKHRVSYGANNYMGHMFDHCSVGFDSDGEICAFNSHEEKWISMFDYLDNENRTAIKGCLTEQNLIDIKKLIDFVNDHDDAAEITVNLICLLIKLGDEDITGPNNITFKIYKKISEPLDIYFNNKLNEDRFDS